jgi:hypothetical protein
VTCGSIVEAVPGLSTCHLLLLPAGLVQLTDTGTLCGPRMAVPLLSLLRSPYSTLRPEETSEEGFRG